jgi:hypothetical protein
MLILKCFDCLVQRFYCYWDLQCYEITFFSKKKKYYPYIELNNSEMLCESFQKSYVCRRLYILLPSPLFTFINASCSAFGFMNYLAHFLEAALSSEDFRVL